MSPSSCHYGCNGGGIMDEFHRRPCRCLALSFARIPRPLHGKTFDTFDADRAPEQFRRAKAWAETFSPGSHSLMLFGSGKGSGKTHLMAATAIAIVLGRKVNPALDSEVRFTLSPEFMAGVTADGFSDRLDALSRVRLLFLDDVGQADEGDPPWLRAKKRDAWFRLMNHREMNRLTTVCTSNLEKIEQFADVLGEAAADRLLGMCGKPGLVKFAGITSYRLRALLEEA